MTVETEAMSDHTTEPLGSRRNHWLNHVRRHAVMIPDAPALTYRGESTTWRQLDARAQAFGAALGRRGVQSGDRVLLVLLNRSEYVEAVLGVNAIGAIAVPVNVRMSPAEVAFLISDSQSSMIVTETLLAPLAEAASAAADHPVELTVVVGGATGEGQLGYEELLSEASGDRVDTDIPEDSIALIMYTSGTTGKPKGAMLSHQNLQAQSTTCLQILHTRSDDVGSCVAPMFHIAALGAMVPLLYMGARSVIHPLGAFDPDELLDVLEREGTTSIFLVPAQWQAVCAAQRARPRALALRIISWGAAPASDTVLRAMGEVFPDAMNVAVFGQTEMSPITCALDGADALRKLGSVGRVVPSVTARVVDPAGDDVPDGQVGEIVYRGANLMAGYWQNPEGTAEAFRGGWFHSGDLVRRDDEGFVFVVDRAKDMIISGGENIYCAEVENALYGHPSISEAAVIARADAEWGEIPIAVVVLADGVSDLRIADIDGYLTENLARYKHPKELIIVDELPRNAGGKVIKPSLRSTYGSKDAGLANG